MAAWKLLLPFFGLLANAQQASPSVTSMSSSSAASSSTTSVIYSYSTAVPVQPTIQKPDAPDSQQLCPGYKASNITHTPNGLTASLRLAGPACNTYGLDIDALDLIVEYQAKDRLHVEIVPTYLDSSNSSHYLPLEDLVIKPRVESSFANTTALNDLDFSWGNSPSFWFKVMRRDSGEELFSTQGSKIVFQNQFVELKTPLPQDYNLYGLGETIGPFRLGNNYNKTMWAVDQGDGADANLYGSFPVYYDTRYYETNQSTGSMNYVPWNETSLDGNYTSLTHAVYYRNPGHGQDILLRPDGLTWRTIGGEIDLYFYSGPTVEKALKSITTSAYGLPAMHQYFTLGYHQCRWGYQNWTVMQDVVSSFADFGIPLENIWNDIDYMNVFRDFTLDPNFNESAGHAFLDSIHSQGIHYIPIFDSPLYIPNPSNASDAYAPYSRGHEMDVFLKENNSTDEYIGRFWPGFTVFPDWLSANAQDWWTNEVVTFHRTLSFDAIWIDLSEIASQCVGSCGTHLLQYNPAPDPIMPPTTFNFPEGFNITNATEASSASSYNAMQSTSASSSTVYPNAGTPTPSAERNLNYPPYAINNQYGNLAQSVVSPNASHDNGVVEYDVHNLYGNTIVNATYQALLSVFPGKRPFIIGRSTSIGFGRVGGHWGGDNTSLWFYMMRSISQALQFSLFGVPMFGVDVCGFNADTDEELCSRWMQLGAIASSFYRNHNTYGAISQEPYRWASVTNATLYAMDIRYSLLPYYYTLLQKAHTEGTSFARALSWEFPNEPSLAQTESQLLVGPSILVTPVLEPNVSSVRGVFPGANKGQMWYDWANQTAISDPAALRGENITIDAPLGIIPVHVRGGSILPLQPRADKRVTRDMRQNPWSVLAALDKRGRGEGELYLDDGESITPNATKKVVLNAYPGAVHASVVGRYEDRVPLANVTVLGLQMRPSMVSFGNVTLRSWTYDDARERLAVTGLMNATSAGAWSGDWTLTWS